MAKSGLESQMTELSRRLRLVNELFGVLLSISSVSIDPLTKLLNESTRSGAVDASAQFTEEMMKNLDRAMDHPDMTPELAALLSTSQVELEYKIHSGVEVRE